MNYYKCDEMSVRAYNLLIGAVLLWGFVINALMCIYLTDTFMEWNFTMVLIGYFIIAIAGISLSISSDNAFISFIGYNLVVLPVGVVLSIFIRLSEVTNYDIVNTLYVTAGLTLFMMAAAMIFPGFFSKLERVLFLTLLGVIVVEFIAIMINKSMPSQWDLLVAGLFCLYIGYDWGKAQALSKTADNAVDMCVALYLDIINLLMRLLSSKSKKRD